MEASHPTLQVGLDEGHDEVFACLVDAQGRKLQERRFTVDVTGLMALVSWLRKRSRKRLETIAVALERPGGPVAETLLVHGVRLFTINPKQVDRFRDRHSVAGAKDDSFDAYVLADSLRTDQHLFREVTAEPASVVRLRELWRTREELLGGVNQWENRLRDLWRRYYPQLLELAGGNLHSPFVLALCERYPTPAAAAQADPATVATLLKQHKVRRLSAAEVLAQLQTEPLAVTEGLAETLALRVRLILPLLKAAAQQLKACEQQLEEALGQLSDELAAAAGEGDPGDVALLCSIRGLGPLTCAGLFAEGYRFLRDRDLEGLRRYSGCAALTKASGRTRVVQMRRACNHRLRHICDQWARASVSHDDLAKHHYRQLRARGHNTSRAYRSVADRLLRIVIAILRNRTPYDPERPRRAQQLAS